MKDDNQLLEFYKRHHISPVHQDIADFSSHLRRREKLYHQLGIPIRMFGNGSVLEVGPGSGYNTLTLLAWGANPILVEPNPKGVEEMIRLLESHGYGENRWTLFHQSIEEFKTETSFDIILAEGFIPGLNHRKKVIEKLKSLVVRGGIIVVTCVDDIGFLFENLRRIVAHRLLADISDMKEQVEILSRAFGTHYESLKFSTRSVEDWVTDQFICPTFMGQMFSIEECINEFGVGFDLMGTSPSIFTDTYWYKNIQVDTKSKVLEDFSRKRHMFIQWTLKESERDPILNKHLLSACSKLRTEFNAHQFDQGSINDLLLLLGDVRLYAKGIDPFVDEALMEIEGLLKSPAITVKDVTNMPVFSRAFGRGMQYVSLTRLFTEISMDSIRT